jgi:hypothetical protein
MRQIFVDSRDRSSGTSANFEMALPQTLSLSSGHQGRIDDLRLPNAIPTISAASNKIDVLMNGFYSYLTMQNGQCNQGSELADRIRNVLTTVSGNWNVSYDASQMTLTITCSNDFTFTGGTFMLQLLNRPYVRSDNRSYLFLYVPLQGLDICYLCCPNFSHADNVGPKHSSDVLCAIPITVGYGAVQHYSMSNSVFFDVPAVTLQQLSFQLRDRDYNIVNSVANISFTLTID